MWQYCDYFIVSQYVVSYFDIPTKLGHYAVDVYWNIYDQYGEQNVTTFWKAGDVLWYLEETDNFQIGNTVVTHF